MQLILGRQDAQPSAVLPATALVKAGGAPSVWVVDAENGSLARAPGAGGRLCDDAVVVTGLAAGLKVVSVGTQKLVASMKVAPIDRTASGLNVERVPAAASRRAGPAASVPRGEQLMKSFNLSEWAVTHRPMVLFLIIAHAARRRVLVQPARPPGGPRSSTRRR